MLNKDCIMIKIIFIICFFFSFSFAECKIVQNTSNDIVFTSSSEDKIVYYDGKKLLLKSLPSLKTTLDKEYDPRSLTSVILSENEIIAGFKNGFAYSIYLNGYEEAIINPNKTSLYKPVSSIAKFKDKLAFVIGNESVVIYDKINKIYKKTNIDNSSKVMFSKFMNDIFYFACYDRSFYELDTLNLKLKKLFKTPSLITSFDLINNKPVVGLINGNAYFEGRTYEISKGALTKILVSGDSMIFGDDKGDIYIYDLNFKFKNKMKTSSDTIRDMFIDKNLGLVVLLWDSRVYSCKIN